MSYTVCIQAAGSGSRLTIGRGLHKALIPINKKSVLSRIIDLYPSDTNFVILLGYKGHQIKAFIDIVYPNHNFTYVNVDRYEGKGSGPGYSLTQAKSYLKKPFIFMACDTIVFQRPPLPTTNWIGISNAENSEDYLIAEVKDHKVTAYYDKKESSYIYGKSQNYGKNKNKGFDAFIGLAGVYDYEVFWKSLETDTNLLKEEIQVTNGLNSLISEPYNTEVISFEWVDTGSDTSYSYARQHFRDTFLLKPDEFLYKEKKKIIKFFLDPDRARKRFERAKYLNGINPKINRSGENFIWYKFIKGNLISNTNEKGVFINFLSYMNEKIWSKTPTSKKKRMELVKKANEFYKVKTLSRVNQYIKINPDLDNIKWINNALVEPILYLLEKVEWDILSNGIFTNFHGDPQPENVLLKEDKTFALIDWREDFGGDLEFGDVYYDLGKIYHSLIVTQKKIREKKFFVNYTDELAFYSFSKRRNLIKYLDIFEEFIKEQGYDLNRVRLMSTLIYLNIAPLHHQPYSELLFLHGKLELSKIIKNKNIYN